MLNDLHSDSINLTHHRLLNDVTTLRYRSARHSFRQEKFSKNFAFLQGQGDVKKKRLEKG